MVSAINYEPIEGSHVKLANVWMYKLRGFDSLKLRVTSPITVRFQVNQYSLVFTQRLGSAFAMQFNSIQFTFISNKIVRAEGHAPSVNLSIFGFKNDSLRVKLPRYWVKVLKLWGVPNLKLSTYMYNSACEHSFLASKSTWINSSCQLLHTTNNLQNLLK